MPKPERLIRNDRKIDRFSLEEENEKQADIFSHYAREAANEKETRDEKKADWEKLLAKTEIDIRCGTYPVPLVGETPLKITDKVVSSLAASDESVAKAKKEFIKAEGDYSRAKADENTMEIKRSSINNLKDLYCKYYYENKDSNTAWSTKTDQISEKQSEALNKKKKKEA